MKMLANNEAKVKTWNADYSPQAMKLYSDYSKISSHCNIHFNGDHGYEFSESEDRHTVNLERKRCTCRIWDLGGKDAAIEGSKILEI